MFRRLSSTVDSLIGGVIGCLAAIWFLVWAWPWWLLFPPAILLVLLAFRPTFRTDIMRSLRHEKVDRETASFRRLLLLTLAVSGAVLATVCAFALDLSSLPWWLVPMSLLMLACRLGTLSGEPEGWWPRLIRSLSANLFELLLMGVVTLAAYSIALAWFQTMPLDGFTLDQLRRWDERTRQVHEFFEKYAPGLKVFLVFLGLIIAFRVAATVRPALAGFSGAATSLIARGTKWFGRAATMAALTAGLTFLTVEQGGPLNRMSLQLKNVEEAYSQFQRALSQKMDRALREAIIDRAWKARPRLLKVEMKHAAEFQRKREDFDDMRQTAEADFHIRREMPPGILGAVDLPPKSAIVSASGPLVEKAAGSWTERDLSQAAMEVEAIGKTEESESENSESKDAEEIARSSFERLMPADRLFETSPVLVTLKAHYPVFGEFLNAIASSVSEASFDTLRNSAVRAITALRARSPGLDLDSAVIEQAAARTAGIRIDTRRFDRAWADRWDPELTRLSASIADADERLAREVEWRRTANTVEDPIAAELGAIHEAQKQQEPREREKEEFVGRSKGATGEEYEPRREVRTVERPVP